MSHINVTINGRQYRMACEEGQEARLLKLAESFEIADRKPARQVRRDRRRAADRDGGADGRAMNCSTPAIASAASRKNWRRCATSASRRRIAPGRRRPRSPTRSTPPPTASRRPRRCSTAPSAAAWRSVDHRPALTLAVCGRHGYIGRAKLCRASGAIYPRGLIDPSGNCPWPGPWTPVIWCPPTFVGNSGIECSNGHRGFALFFCRRDVCRSPAPAAVILREAEYPVRRNLSS